MATNVDDDNRAATRQDAQARGDRECSTGTKVKRKSRSTRRRLNAMMSNASFHFSDTDSEGELTMITSKIGRLNAVLQTDCSQCNPVISVTVAEGSDSETGLVKDNLDRLIADGEARSRSRRSSIAEALTDVDEIYSDPDNDERNAKIGVLNVLDDSYQGETDLEDLEVDEDIQETIYVTPRVDILMDLCGEVITTKEGDGPFSVEVRNRLLREQVSIDRDDSENVPVMPDTESEDMEASEDDTKLDEAAACCDVYDDLDFLIGSQTVMTNRMENTLHVPDTAEEAISDCHTDVEDVD